MKKQSPLAPRHGRHYWRIGGTKRRSGAGDRSDLERGAESSEAGSEGGRSSSATRLGCPLVVPACSKRAEKRPRKYARNLRRVSLDFVCSDRRVFRIPPRQ